MQRADKMVWRVDFQISLNAKWSLYRDPALLSSSLEVCRSMRNTQAHRAWNRLVAVTLMYLFMSSCSFFCVCLVYLSFFLSVYFFSFSVCASRIAIHKHEIWSKACRKYQHRFSFVCRRIKYTMCRYGLFRRAWQNLQPYNKSNAHWMTREWSKNRRNEKSTWSEDIIKTASKQSKWKMFGAPFRVGRSVCLSAGRMKSNRSWTLNHNILHWDGNVCIQAW